jgi:hypothetical protein
MRSSGVNEGVWISTLGNSVDPEGSSLETTMDGSGPPFSRTWIFICDKALDIAMKDGKLSLLN